MPAPQYRIMPAASQRKKRHQVIAGNGNISHRQVATAPKGTQGTQGVRKGRWRSGSVTRRTTIPMATRIKANSVPMLHSSRTSLILLTAASPATNKPVRMVVDQGVLN